MSRKTRCGVGGRGRPLWCKEFAQIRNTIDVTKIMMEALTDLSFLVMHRVGQIGITV